MLEVFFFYFFLFKTHGRKTLGFGTKMSCGKEKKIRNIQKCLKEIWRGKKKTDVKKWRQDDMGCRVSPFKTMAEGKNTSPWQLIDTSNWTVHILSVVPVTRFVGRSQPATGAEGHRSWPADLPKYDQLTQIIGVRESWQLQYDAQGTQLFVTCETSVRP